MLHINLLVLKGINLALLTHLFPIYPFSTLSLPYGFLTFSEGRIEKGCIGNKWLTSQKIFLLEAVLPQVDITTVLSLLMRMGGTCCCLLLFQMISQNEGRTEIDLFASRTCCQLHAYMAWRPGSQESDNKCSPTNFRFLYLFFLSF